jgi:hypothetical protein
MHLQKEKAFWSPNVTLAFCMQPSIKLNVASLSKESAGKATEDLVTELVLSFPLFSELLQATKRQSAMGKIHLSMIGLF